MTIELSAYLAALAAALLMVLVALLVLAFRELAGLPGVREALAGDPAGDLPLLSGHSVVGFDTESVNHRTESTTRFDPLGKKSIVLLAEPTCTACQSAIQALDAELQNLIDAGVAVTVVTTEDPRYVQAIDAFRDSSCLIVTAPSSVVASVFQTRSTPLLCAIDPTGRVVGATRSVSRSDVRAIARRLSPDSRTASFEHSITIPSIPDKK